jgi:hypothetical protein
MKALTITVSSMAWLPRKVSPTSGRTPATIGMSAQWIAQKNDADIPIVSSRLDHFPDCSVLMLDSFLIDRVSQLMILIIQYHYTWDGAVCQLDFLYFSPGGSGWLE